MKDEQKDILEDRDETWEWAAIQWHIATIIGLVGTVVFYFTQQPYWFATGILSIAFLLLGVYCRIQRAKEAEQ